MYSTVAAGALCGLSSFVVQVEVCVTGGLPCFDMVGSLSSEVREARERVKVALLNSNIAIPPRRITINLAPADVRKEGNGYDFPIAVGVLLALGSIPVEAIIDTIFVGELGLNGELKSIHGILPMILQLREKGYKRFVIPKKNLIEVSQLTKCIIIGVESLSEFINHSLKHSLESLSHILLEGHEKEELELEMLDYKDIAGQEFVKRGVEIAAAGFHNLLMIGPPGTGKSMIAKRIPSILPPMTQSESLEVSQIYSISGQLSQERPLIRTRPFLNPHHTVSSHAMAGGGRIPKPGIVSLAHKGVLFLDELPEFKRSVLEILRQPIEDKEIHIARTQGNYIYPADFMMIGAMNPCPCGYHPDAQKCTCRDYEVRRYLHHISGPLLDRMDLCARTNPISLKDLRNCGDQESSEQIRIRVMKAREIQLKRYEKEHIMFNGQLDATMMHQYCDISKELQEYVEQYYQMAQLSARSYHRMMKVARTIADLAGEEQILKEHLTEAMCYRIDEQIG